MIPRLPTRRMREHPDLHQLKRQAKELLTRYRAGAPKALAEVNAHYRSADAATFALHDAQLVIARAYGFDSWPKLKAYVDGITIRRLVDAVKDGDLARVQAMLRSRPELADMQLSYGDEHRAIHYAVMHRQPEIARLLLRKGANARAGIHPHRSATSAWTLANERGFADLVAVIDEEERRRKPVPKANDEPEPVNTDEALRAAVADGNISLLQSLHAEGRLRNPIRGDGGGLLTVAVESNRIDMLRFLLDCGFDPNERVSSGQGDWVSWSQGYPLWQAAAQGSRAIAELLLDRGADPNVHVDSSGSAVYSAYSHRQWDMAALLESRGGLLTHDIAALYRRTDVIRQLLQTASPQVMEEALRFAADSGAADIVGLLLPRVGWPRDDDRWFNILCSPLSFWHHIPWLYAGNKEFDRAGYLECFRLILNACDATVTGGFGRTVLHEIAAMGDWISDDEVLAFGRTALNAGAAHSQRDTILNSTPLGWASRWGRPTLVKLLLDRGADPHEPEAEPWATPLAWARKRGHLEIVAFLEAAIAS
ncbi:MAG: ankyrin repeat domain-containing protein [Bryobacterales bacterium]|nr:ankyrin repeat domain-containing protein [Bryobacterales bacterium]